MPVAFYRRLLSVDFRVFSGSLWMDDVLQAPLVGVRRLS